MKICKCCGQQSISDDEARAWALETLIEDAKKIGADDEHVTLENWDEARIVLWTDDPATIARRARLVAWPTLRAARIDVSDDSVVVTGTVWPDLLMGGVVI